MQKVPDQDEAATSFRVGSTAIVGRPNVGKSSILNRILGMKLSIVSKKAQTTRHRILGVYSDEESQILFLDTPGFQLRHTSFLNSAMNRSVSSTISEVDVLIFVLEYPLVEPDDLKLLAMIPEGLRVICMISKTDKAKNTNEVLPFITKVNELYAFEDIVPTSAIKSEGIDNLISVVKGKLPFGDFVYPEDEITDRPERFFAAEIIREKLFQLMGEEIPYGVTVEIEEFEIKEGLRRIGATIIVSKNAHKGMIIGAGGRKLKAIGTKARLDMERFFDGKVFLRLWVKVKKGWMDDGHLVKQFGYD
jgi:GTP-binding protein Era